MNRLHLFAGILLAVGPALALAQGAPESLLPPGFDRPARSASGAASAPRIEAQQIVEQVPDAGKAGASPASGKPTLPSGMKIPSIAELESLTPDELGDLLGLKNKADIPAAQRRALKRVGIIDQLEGGFPAHALAAQDAGLIRAIIVGNKGALVSRWGHILLRRALASRLDAPAAMNPADFAGLRAALLVRMGEGEAARAMVQDIDTGNYSPLLVNSAVDAYVATADFTGLCPVFSGHGSLRKDAQWEALKAICTAFQGDGSTAFSRLDSMQANARLPKIDLLLAQKYAGATGRTRRAVKIEWEGVNSMTPLRYGLTIAVGLEPPSSLLEGNRRRYDLAAASAPMLGLLSRAPSAERAAGIGVLSNAALVDLYSQISGLEDADSSWAKRADQLQTAYTGADDRSRVAAMSALWEDASDEDQRYARLVLTARAAARIRPDAALSDDAASLIAAMLAAGLDRNAMAWAPFCENGSQGWALLAISAPSRTKPVNDDAIDTFADADNSTQSRRSALLVAGLAGLGRLSPDAIKDWNRKLELDLDRQSRWSRLITQAARLDDAALVALLAGLGMQGSSWDKMTPRHLFHIVSALNEVGLSAEARMIAAEAMVRG